MIHQIKSGINKSQKNRAFSIIEMLVVIAIFGIVTGVVLFQYGQFNSQIIMTNTAYEIATTIQQAQVYALGHKTDVRGADNMNNRYGVYFDTNEADGRKHFIFYIDIADTGPDNNEANGICDDDSGSGTGSCFECIPGDECLDKFRITRDILIEKICLSNDGDPVNSDGDCTKEETLSATVTFQRPNPDAIFTDIDEGYDPIASMGIVLTNRFETKSAVIIRNTGQISVMNIVNQEE